MNELRRLLEMGLDPRNYGYSQDPTTGEFVEPQQNELANMIQQAGQQNRDVLTAPQAFDMGGNPEPTVNGDFQVYAGEGRPQSIDLNPAIAQAQKERQAQPQQPQQQLGAEVEVMGRGKGRYAQDGRSVVFADGSKHDLFPQASAAAAQAAFKQLQVMTDLEDKRAKTAKTVEETNAMRMPKPEKAPEGYRFKPDGSLEAIAGGPAATKQAEKGDQAQSVVESAADTIRKLDEMIGQRDASGKFAQGARPHEGFEDAVGATWKPLARFIPGTDAADFQSRLDEVKGGAFLKAFETLKGGGQITVIEGEKATAAITRMGTSQSEAEFVKAALEFREVVRRGMERAQRQQKPQGQTIKGSFRYLGTEG